MAGVGPAGGWLLGEQAQSPPLPSSDGQPSSVSWLPWPGEDAISPPSLPFKLTKLPPIARDVAKHIRRTQSLVRNTFALFYLLRKFKESKSANGRQ